MVSCLPWKVEAIISNLGRRNLLIIQQFWQPLTRQQFHCQKATFDWSMWQHIIHQHCTVITEQSATSPSTISNPIQYANAACLINSWPFNAMSLSCQQFTSSSVRPSCHANSFPCHQSMSSSYCHMESARVVTWHSLVLPWHSLVLPHDTPWYCHMAPMPPFWPFC